MTLKEQIKAQLVHLKLMGKDRRTIERELHYSENYLDQVLSKGGNEKVYQALVDYQKFLEQQPADESPAGTMETMFGLQARIQDLNQQLFKEQRNFFTQVLTNLKTLEQNQYLVASMLQGGQEVMFAAMVGELKGKSSQDLVHLARKKGQVKLQKHVESGKMAVSNF